MPSGADRRHARRMQRTDWVHKTANVLNKLPKSKQRQAKAKLRYIWMAGGRKEAEKTMDAFASAYEAKYPSAVACLTKDRDGHGFQAGDGCIKNLAQTEGQ